MWQLTCQSLDIYCIILAGHNKEAETEGREVKGKEREIGIVFLKHCMKYLPYLLPESCSSYTHIPYLRLG